MSGFKKQLNKHLNKACLAQAIQNGIAAPGDAEVQEINATVTGFIPTLGQNTVGLFGYHGAFGYDTTQYPAVPDIGPVLNPACGNGTNDEPFGTLVIDPNLPPGSAQQFDLIYTLTDNSAGSGSFILFCPNTGQFTGVQGSAFGGGPHTQSFDASSLNCPIEDVLVGITAWGANSNPIYEGNCDQISEEIGTLVSVTPSQCAPTLDCFEELFGKSLADLVVGSGVLSGFATDTGDDKRQLIPVNVYRPNPDLVRGYRYQTWGGEGERVPGTRAEFDLKWLPDPNGGTPTHVDGTTPAFVTETDTRFSPVERGQDEHLLTYCIRNDSDTPLEIEDIDGRAESLEVYVGCGCNMTRTYERMQANDAGQNQPPYTSDGAVVATIPAHSFSVMQVYIHDPGPDFSGFNPQALDGREIVSYQAKLEPVCETVMYDPCSPYQLAEDESFKPLTGWDCKDDCGVGAAGGDLEKLENYEITQFQNNGFFDTDQMNAQLQIFNTDTVPGVAAWEIRFESNYDITSFQPSGATAGAIQQTDLGSTYSYVIPMTGAIPGNNGNVQVAIQGTRHPQSTDTQATSTNAAVYG